MKKLTAWVLVLVTVVALAVPAGAESFVEKMEKVWKSGFVQEPEEAPSFVEQMKKVWKSNFVQEPEEAPSFVQQLEEAWIAYDDAREKATTDLELWVACTKHMFRSSCLWGLTLDTQGLYTKELETLWEDYCEFEPEDDYVAVIYDLHGTVESLAYILLQLNPEYEAELASMIIDLYDKLDAGATIGDGLYSGSGSVAILLYVIAAERCPQATLEKADAAFNNYLQLMETEQELSAQIFYSLDVSVEMLECIAETVDLDPINRSVVETFLETYRSDVTVARNDTQRSRMAAKACGEILFMFAVVTNPEFGRET